MKFKKVYTEIENRLTDSILSLWATGNAPFQKHLKELFQSEKLLAEPVFQNTFPWTPAEETFGDLNNLFDEEFIEKLDKIKGEFEFPKNRNPYKHQIESWQKLLTDKKSIAVTTGTGSGKTECFMLPVLQDLYENCRNDYDGGVRAIFLYPLNALIGSQKKRMDAWVRALGGMTYAVYNGNTPESYLREYDNQLPELVSRKQIRQTPPQILFTNPSMLEYIMVRKKDVELLNKSHGKLRWILLDEAHTLVGSSATEMALLIRRVVDAFGVDIKDVRFAITSATVGSGTESQIKLKEFMTNLCGINPNSIEIITGKREFKELPKDFEDDKKVAISEIRKFAYQEAAVRLSDITNKLGSNVKTMEDKLGLIDDLIEKTCNGESILPLRAHLFARGIGGLYVCSNPNCKKHGGFSTKYFIGTITSTAEKNCSDCDYPIYELVACRSCGNELLTAEMQTINQGDNVYHQGLSISQSEFLIEDDDSDEKGIQALHSQTICFTRRIEGKRYVDNASNFGIEITGKVNRGQSVFVETFRNNECVCPHCNSNLDNPQHFRISSSFINRILSDVFLENTPKASPVNGTMLWDGHKYISFTDSRQGTAKISALINIDNENNWVRSQVFHKLWQQRKSNINNASTGSNFNSDEINQMKILLEGQNNPVMRKALEAQIEQAISNQQPVQLNNRLKWEEIYDFLNMETVIRRLFRNNNPRENNNTQLGIYSKALLYDNFARRLPRERSLENLGLVSIVYPGLDKVQLPSIAAKYNVTLSEWKLLVKIGIDFLIRNKFHFFYNWDLLRYSTLHYSSKPIYSSNSELEDVDKWPKFTKKGKINRLSLLLCAGLGFHNIEDIDRIVEDEINEFLQEIWSVIRKNVLTSQGEGGYMLDIYSNSSFQIAEKLWLCPVKKRLIDSHFKGYSPWIAGVISEENFSQFKIKETEGYIFPEFEYPFNLDDNNIVDVHPTKEWVERNAVHWKEQGIWNNLHEKIILNRPVYLSGEHSAQQSSTRLKELEEKFENAEINILNCSTTMEMGVDIGGITTVVMNNVPPGPANYLQRAGRAGRRKESKSLAFTVCAPNPVGLNALANPSWALTHKIAPPFISFTSAQLVERHMNSFLLGKFIQTEEIGGINVADDVQKFFISNPTGEIPIAQMFSNRLQDSDFNFSEQLTILTKNTPYADKTSAYLKRLVLANIDALIHKTINKEQAFVAKLDSLKAEFGENSPAFKSVKRQYNSFHNKNALTYLVEAGFLPSAGLPTGVVEFETLNSDDLARDRKISRENPSYFITRALTEFAPGNLITIDGLSYKSAGIILDSVRGNQASKEIIQLCVNCGFQRIVEAAEGQNIDTECTHCNANTFQGINFTDAERGRYTEMIQPAGFAVDIYDTPDRKISEVSKNQYVDPLLINVKPWESESSSIYEIRESDEDGEILYYNVGDGNGYHVCLHCGRTGLTDNALQNHRRLRGGKDDNRNSLCSGNTTQHAIHHNVILGGRFKTDFCEIRIRVGDMYCKDRTLLYSLGAVFTKELAHFLAIEENELDFGVKKYENYSTIFIFDTTKGGAGYSNQFFLHAESIFEEAKIKLDCTCSNACTKCLIDKSTQWHLNSLDRNIALEWLNSVKNLTISNDLLELYPSIKRLSGSLKLEINKINYSSAVSEIWLFISANLPDWDIDSLTFIENLKRRTKLNFVFNSAPIVKNNQELISLIQMSSWSNFYIQNNIDQLNLINLSIIKLKDGSILRYTTDQNSNVVLDLNGNWSNTQEGLIYKDQISSIPEFDSLNFKDSLNSNGNQNTIVEVVLNPTNSIRSTELADEILDSLVGKLDLEEVMRNQTFEVSYSDRYLKTKFGCTLMLQFLMRLKSKIGFGISNFRFDGKKFDNERRPYKFFHEFQSSTDRDNFIYSQNKHIGAKVTNVLSGEIPHYRYFEFKNDEYRIIVRPDAGVEHGWSLTKNDLLFNDNIGLEQAIFIYKRDTHPILYTISVERMK